jgi:ABC-type antimicrobial peptide transport system permease subunit
MLAVFFAGVALLLAGVGLYGVLDYSVLQRRHELGIRIAIGAPIRDIARRATVDIFSMVLLGSLLGAGIGPFLEHYAQSLLYEVKPSDLSVLAVPVAMIVAVTLLAATPPVIRALRIDPVAMLRAE